MIWHCSRAVLLPLLLIEKVKYQICSNFGGGNNTNERVLKGFLWITSSGYFKWRSISGRRNLQLLSLQILKYQDIESKRSELFLVCCMTHLIYNPEANQGKPWSLRTFESRKVPGAVLVCLAVGGREGVAGCLWAEVPINIWLVGISRFLLSLNCELPLLVSDSLLKNVPWKMDLVVVLEH